MMRWLFAAGLFWALISSSQAQLVLNGSASYQRLSQDVYVGGLYLPQASDDATYIRSAGNAKRMRLVVVANRWSPRRWQQMWQNNISINNENISQTPDVGKALMDLTQLLREDLLKGDELSIDYQPGGDTRIYLNGQLALRSRGTELFNFLVNTWIGPLPPSREFRDRMLGKVSDARSQQHRQTLADHSVPLARVNLYSGWVEKELQQKLAQQQAEEAKRRQVEEAKRIEQQRRAEAERKAREEAARRAQLEAEAQRIAQQQAEAEAARQAEQLAQPSSVKSVEVPAAPVVTEVDPQQQQRYLAALLQWRLQEAVDGEVTYPAWARQFEQEGLVQISVTLRRSGDIAEVLPVDNGAHKLLISEVQRALQAVAGKVDIPEQLHGDSWSLPVRYQFRLNDDSPLANPKPVPPEGMPSQTDANAEMAAQPVSLEQYQQQILSQIRQAIRYPKGAQILKKTGRVAYQVTVGANGQLLASTISTSSAHRELNQAVATAIESSAPFAPFPKGSQQSQLVILVEHDFRL